MAQTHESATSPQQQQSHSTPQTPARSGGQQTSLARREPFLPELWTERPFSFMRRFSDEMDRFMDRMLTDSGLGQDWLTPRFRRELGVSPTAWVPPVEIFERDNQLVVRADLPGLRKEDVNIDVADGCLYIQGERRQEHEEKEEGYYRSERGYGSFSRCIALPEGAKAEEAKATFQDGMLEVTMPAPPRPESQHRRIEIQADGNSERGQARAA